MTGLVRKATFLSACGMLIAGSAMAFVPNAAVSIVPCAISLVGASGVTADANGAFTIVVKDVAGNDIKLSEVQHGAGVAIDGTHKKINVTADGTGTAVIRIQGVATKVGPLAGLLGCASITANGTLLTNGTDKPLVAVSVLDLDGGAGSLGLSIGDLSAWLSDFFGGTYYQKDDYDRVSSLNCAGAVGIGDLSKWLTVYFAGGSSANDAPFVTACP